VRNCKRKLCGFVPHSPANFWKEFTRNYPDIKENLRENEIIPNGQLPGSFDVVQVSWERTEVGKIKLFFKSAGP